MNFVLTLNHHNSLDIALIAYNDLKFYLEKANISAQHLNIVKTVLWTPSMRKHGAVYAVFIPCGMNMD